MSEITAAYGVVFFVALSLSLLGIPLARSLAFRWKVIDSPGGRKIHTKDIPMLGGMAVFGSFMLVIVGCLLAFYFLTRFPVGVKTFPTLVRQIPFMKAAAVRLYSLLGGATVIFLVGLADDIIGVKFNWKLKLAAEIAVACWMTASGIVLNLAGHPFLNVLITIVWIVGITNAFNLLDNMDGLSAGVAYICTLMFYIVAARHDQFFLGLIYLTFAGSLLGFLYSNIHPARIFLGDTGALFIGFVLSTLTVGQSFETRSSQSFLPLFMPVIVLSIPIFDTVRVVLIRLYERRSIFQGDRRHLSHRLIEVGMNHRQAVSTIYALTFSLGIGCIALDRADWFTSWVILTQVACVAITVSMILAFARK